MQTEKTYKITIDLAEIARKLDEMEAQVEKKKDCSAGGPLQSIKK